jgi:hypothetical protein
MNVQEVGSLRLQFVALCIERVPLDCERGPKVPKRPSLCFVGGSLTPQETGQALPTVLPRPGLKLAAQGMASRRKLIRFLAECVEPSV